MNPKTPTYPDPKHPNNKPVNDSTPAERIALANHLTELQRLIDTGLTRAEIDLIPPAEPITAHLPTEYLQSFITTDRHPLHYIIRNRENNQRATQ